jgi:hypothetical protein
MRIDPSSSSRLYHLDSGFRAVPGLADPTGISFESVNYPGYYIRHSNFELVLNQRVNTSLFNDDATFYQVSGLANPNYASFRSRNFPNLYIRHRNSLLYLEFEANALFRADATFRTVPSFLGQF